MANGQCHNQRVNINDREYIDMTGIGDIGAIYVSI